MSCLRYEVDALMGRRGDMKESKKQKHKHDHDVVKAFTRELLNVAESDIKLADFIVRNNRSEGVPDDPESTRKLRLSFRRVQYRLATIASIEPSLGADELIERLRDVGKPFGRLRDAEVLEAGVIKALGNRVASPQGRQIMDLAARTRRNLQQKTDELLNSEKYHDTLREVSEFRTSLPTRHTSSETLSPMAERAMHVAWQELRRVAKQAKRNPNDKNLHERVSPPSARSTPPRRSPTSWAPRSKSSRAAWTRCRSTSANNTTSSLRRSGFATSPGITRT